MGAGRRPGLARRRRPGSVAGTRRTLRSQPPFDRRHRRPRSRPDRGQFRPLLHGTVRRPRRVPHPHHLGPAERRPHRHGHRARRPHLRAWLRPRHHAPAETTGRRFGRLHERPRRRRYHTHQPRLALHRYVSQLARRLLPAARGHLRTRTRQDLSHSRRTPARRMDIKLSASLQTFICAPISVSSAASTNSPFPAPSRSSPMARRTCCAEPCGAA